MALKMNVRALRVGFFAMAAALLAQPARGAPPDRLARGAYLAHVTGCIGCHSPRTPAGEVIGGRLLSGGAHAIPAAGRRFYPPNITPDSSSGIGAWSTGDIVKALKTGVTPDGRVLSAAMPWRRQFDLLSDRDALAIAVYLKSVRPIRNEVPPPRSLPDHAAACGGHAPGGRDQGSTAR